MLNATHRHTLLRWIAAGALPVFPFSAEHLEPMVELMARYPQSPPTEMDLTDASLVWLAADTGINTIMTSDVRGFSRYRLPDGRAFEIL